MGRRRCCCYGCVYFYDYFDRAASSDLGSDWYEQAGSWGILRYGIDGVLVEQYDAGGLPTGALKDTPSGPDGTGTANAVVMCTHAITDGLENGMQIQVTVCDNLCSDLDKFYIYLCCDSTSTPETGVEVEFQRITSTTWKTTIKGGGSDGTVVQTVDPYGVHGDPRLYACADALTGMVKAGVNSLTDVFAWTEDADVPDGRYGGIGHNNTSHMNIFNDFVLFELRTTDAVCSDCWCWCLELPLYRYLQAEIEVADGNELDISCIDGLMWEMNWNWNSGVPRWEGTALYETTPGSHISQDYHLLCSAANDDDEDNPGQNISLQLGDLGNVGSANSSTPPYTTGSGTNMIAIPIATESSCNALELKFGPYTISETDGSDVCDTLDMGSLDPQSGDYYIIISQSTFGEDEGIGGEPIAGGAI